MPMKTVSMLLGLCLAAAATAACGGSSAGSSSTGTSPLPTTPPQGTNPCASVSVEAPVETVRERSAAELAKREPRLCRRQPMNVLDSVWRHRAAALRGDVRLAADVPAVSDDIGHIAVIQDPGSITIPANPFDLKDVGLSFTRNTSGGYDVRQGSATFVSTLGQRLSLGDDDSSQVVLPFAATYFGRSFTSLFVNSDGNLTFESADAASTERSVTRFLTGAPRLALQFADLDPSAGGGVFVNTQPDSVTVTWCNVPGFESTRKVTAQLVLKSDGQIDMRYAATTTLPDGIAGVSPGATETFTPVNLARVSSGLVTGGAGAVGEQFASEASIDLAALGQVFYRTHPDTFDQLVVFSDRPLVTDAFAYETTVANRIRGIGAGIFDQSKEFGSAGTLASIAFMDDVNKYPADPTLKFTGANSTLGLIGHESGHRWLVTLRFTNSLGAGIAPWLGRDDVHWSFFMDSDASFVEGNEIEEQGGGVFKTTEAVERYSALDQYAMGLRDESEVPPAFYVDSPVNVTPVREKDSNPRVGVTFSGTKRTVLIQDVVAALGPRQPGVADSPKVHRQAFVFVVGPGTAVDRAAVDKIDRFRREWEPYFAQATGGRMRVETRLTP